MGYFEDDALTDSPLVQAGHREAVEVGNQKDSPRYFRRKSEVKLVLVSPLARTLQTASNVWKTEIEAAGFAFPDWANSELVEKDAQSWVRVSKVAAEKSSSSEKGAVDPAY